MSPAKICAGERCDAGGSAQEGAELSRARRPRGLSRRPPGLRRSDLRPRRHGPGWACGRWDRLRPGLGAPQPAPGGRRCGRSGRRQRAETGRLQHGLGPGRDRADDPRRRQAPARERLRPSDRGAGGEDQRVRAGPGDDPPGLRRARRARLRHRRGAGARQRGGPDAAVHAHPRSRRHGRLQPAEERPGHRQRLLALLELGQRLRDGGRRQRDGARRHDLLGRRLSRPAGQLRPPTPDRMPGDRGSAQGPARAADRLLPLHPDIRQQAGRHQQERGRSERRARARHLLRRPAHHQEGHRDAAARDLRDEGRPPGRRSEGLGLRRRRGVLLHRGQGRAAVQQGQHGEPCGPPPAA